MKINYGIIVSMSIWLLSCSDTYEQGYQDYAEYNKSSLRNKSWFPQRIIFDDAYNLKSASCLDSLSAFGEFNYSKDLPYDSIFNSKDVEHIPLDVYLQKINRNKLNMPNWFHEPDNNSTVAFEAINIDRFYISKDSLNKRISFVLCY
jgi:hypothetical protein